MTRKLTSFFVLVLAVVTFATVAPVIAEETVADDPNVVFQPNLFEGMEYRSLGFSRGGRSTAVTGIPSQPLTYYFGSTGGGVWKTADGGIREHFAG
jgi:hypothetical protein